MMMVALAFAFGVLTAAPPMSGPELNHAVQDYQAILAGRMQLMNLPLRDRRAVIALDRWLRSQQAVVASETKDECKARLGSSSPSQLEEALLDLKCSQRPN